MKCFNCQNKIKCNEQLVFNLDKLKQWHKHIYKNPYATSIQHLLTSDFSTLLSEYPCHKQLNAICHLTISLILAEISHTFLTDKTSTIAYAFLTEVDEHSPFQIDTDDNDDAAIKITTTIDIIIPSKTKLIADISLCFHSHLLPQIETIL